MSNKFIKHDKKGFETDNLNDQIIVDHLIKNIPMIVVAKSLYIYEDGVYKCDPNGVFIKNKIKKLLPKDIIKQNKLDQVYRLLLEEYKLQASSDQFNACPKHYINFTNGIYDPIKNCMLKHDPKYLMLNQIPYDFDPTGKCSGPAMDGYLNKSLPNLDDQKTIWEYLGYIMTFDTCFQKFLILTGDGGTGKSIIIDIVQQIVGESNFSSVALQDLNQRFFPSNLQGKLLNACGDLPSTAMRSVDAIKKAVGEDSLLCEKKFQMPFSFFSYAKLLFSANEIPVNLDEKSNALYRRMLIVNMNVVISEKDKDIHLKEKLKNEMDYIIFKSVEGLKRLYANGMFTESEESKAKIQQLKRIADTVQCFIEDMIVDEERSYIARSTMYKKYVAYCKKEERKSVLGKEKFFANLQTKGYHATKSNGIYIYRNIVFAENAFHKEADTPFTCDAKNSSYCNQEKLLTS